MRSFSRSISLDTVSRNDTGPPLGTTSNGRDYMHISLACTLSQSAGRRMLESSTFPTVPPMPQRELTLAQADPDIWRAISEENARQEAHIELIASENYASRAVLAAQGSQLTNKYAEGYPGKRYYGGCEYVDVAEKLAIDRAK